MQTEFTQKMWKDLSREKMLNVTDHCCCSVVSDSLQSHGLQPFRLFFHGIFQERILEQVVMPFCRRSRSRDQIRVSCISRIGSRILYCWAISYL